MMETVQIQLSPTLVQQIEWAAPLGKTLSQIVAEAIQMWLERQQEEKNSQDRVLQVLRQTGIVMTSERQRTLAKAMMAPLPLEEPPTRAQVEASLSKLQVPLSEEIIAMRGAY